MAPGKKKKKETKEVREIRTVRGYKLEETPYKAAMSRASLDRNNLASIIGYMVTAYGQGKEILVAGERIEIISAPNQLPNGV